MRSKMHEERGARGARCMHEERDAWVSIMPNTLIFGINFSLILGPEFSCFIMCGLMITLRLGCRHHTQTEHWVLRCHHATVKQGNF
jgi:hypothetical protein